MINITKKMETFNNLTFFYNNTNNHIIDILKEFFCKNVSAIIASYIPSIKRIESSQEIIHFDSALIYIFSNDYLEIFDIRTKKIKHIKKTSPEYISHSNKKISLKNNSQYDIWDISENPHFLTSVDRKYELSESLSYSVSIYKNYIRGSNREHNYIRVVDHYTGKNFWISVEKNIQDKCISPYGKYLIVFLNHKMILYEINDTSYHLKKKIKKDTFSVKETKWFGDSLVAIQFEDKKVHIIDTINNKHFVYFSGCAKYIKFLKNGNLITISDTLFREIDLKGKGRELENKFGENIELSLCENFIASNFENEIKIFNIKNGTITSFSVKNEIIFLLWCPDTSLIIHTNKPELILIHSDYSKNLGKHRCSKKSISWNSNFSEIYIVGKKSINFI